MNSSFPIRAFVIGSFLGIFLLLSTAALAEKGGKGGGGTVSRDAKISEGSSAKSIQVIKADQVRAFMESMKVDSDGSDGVRARDFRTNKLFSGANPIVDGALKHDYEFMRGHGNNVRRFESVEGESNKTFKDLDHSFIKTELEKATTELTSDIFKASDAKSGPPSSLTTSVDRLFDAASKKFKPSGLALEITLSAMKRADDEGDLLAAIKLLEEADAPTQKGFENLVLNYRDAHKDAVKSGMSDAQAHVYAVAQEKIAVLEAIKDTKAIETYKKPFDELTKSEQASLKLSDSDLEKLYKKFACECSHGRVRCDKA